MNALNSAIRSSDLRQKITVAIVVNTSMVPTGTATA
jgi:hypothetical protein